MAPFVYGGGESRFFSLQNAKSQDWEVGRGSNKLFHKVMTHRGVFGVRTPPKSICTQRHTRLKIDKENPRFWGCPDPFVPFGRKYFLGRKFSSRQSNTFGCSHKPRYSTLELPKLAIWPEKHAEISAFFGSKTSIWPKSCFFKLE